MYSNNTVLLWEVTVWLFTGKKILPFVFNMRMFPPFKKTMRRGSPLKFIVLRNYQNNSLLHFLQKATFISCNFASMQWVNEALLLPESKKKSYKFTVAIHLCLAFQEDWWSIRGWAKMFSICQNDLVWNYHAESLAHNIILMCFTVHYELRDLGKKTH